MDKFDVGDVVKYGNVISRIVSKCNTFTIYSKYSRYLLENNKHNMFFIKENELTIVKPKNKLNKSFWKRFEKTGTIIETGECDKERSKLDRIREIIGAQERYEYDYGDDTPSGYEMYAKLNNSAKWSKRVGILKQHITNQQMEIENKRKAFEHMQYISQEHLDKLDKIQEIINHADEMGLDLIYYQNIKKILEEAK